MKKPHIVGILVAVALVILGIAATGYWYYTKSKAPAKSAEDITTEAVVEQKEPAKPTRAGAIEAYEAGKLAQAQDGKVVLWFCAKWSSTCKQLEKELKADVAKFPKNFTILTLDYDKSAVLKKQYQVPFENTYVQVDASGTMVNRWSGSETLAEIVALSK